MELIGATFVLSVLALQGVRVAVPVARLVFHDRLIGG